MEDSLSLEVGHGGTQVKRRRQPLIQQGLTPAATDIGNPADEGVQSAPALCPCLHTVREGSTKAVQDQKVKVAFVFVLSEGIGGGDSSELDDIGVLQIRQKQSLDRQVHGTGRVLVWITGNLFA